MGVSVLSVKASASPSQLDARSNRTSYGLPSIEMHHNRGLVMLDAYKPALNDGRDNCTEYRRSNVQGPFAGEIGLLHGRSSTTTGRFATSVRGLVGHPNGSRAD